MKKNIVLVGLMGAGKSSVGQKLSQDLMQAFIDTDSMIENQENKTIQEIFDIYGEAYFRELENNIIKEISKTNNKIISIGGGAFQNLDNILNLKQNGFIFYLKASPKNLFERIKNSNNRPLLNADNPLNILEKLLIQREPNYLKADFIINTELKTLNEITEEIIKVYNANS